MKRDIAIELTGMSCADYLKVIGAHNSIGGKPFGKIDYNCKYLRIIEHRRQFVNVKGYYDRVYTMPQDWDNIQAIMNIKPREEEKQTIVKHEVHVYLHLDSKK